MKKIAMFLKWCVLFSLMTPSLVSANCADLAKGFGDVVPNQADGYNNKGQDYDTILKRNFITFAVYEDLPPYSFRQEGVPKGIDIELGKLIAKALKVEAKFNFFSADENVDADFRNQVWKGSVVGGDVSNVMLHAPYNKDLACRNEMVVLNGQYFNETIAIAYRKKTFTENPPTVPYFRSHKVGVENDSVSAFYLENFNHGMLLPNIVHFKNLRAAMQGMTDGEVDAVMGVRGMLQYFANREQAVHTPNLINFAVRTWTLGIAVRHNYRELAYEIDYIIEQAVADGRIKKIFENFGISWSPPDY